MFMPCLRRTQPDLAYFAKGHFSILVRIPRLAVCHSVISKRSYNYLYTLLIHGARVLTVSGDIGTGLPSVVGCARFSGMGLQA